MILLNNPYLFLKGTCEVTIKDIADGRIVMQNNKVSTNNFTTSVEMGPIRAGLGNPIAIQIASNTAVNLELTTEDFSMEARAMQMGTKTAYNAIVPVCASVKATTTTLTVPNAEPVAFYGDGEKYAYVAYENAADPGKAYVISDGGVIQDFVAVPDTTYNVVYYERRADSKYFAISSMIAPGVYSVSAKMAVFSTQGANAGERGTLVGYASYIIPRMQFGGDAGTNGGQTENAKTTLSGTALSYEEGVEAGVCADCSFPNLAYMTFQPITFNGTGAITAMAVVGGDIDLVVGAGNAKVIPVKYIMADQTVVQPKYSDLTFDVDDETKATVSGGVITGVAAGDTTLTIEGPDGSNVEAITVGVHVTAS